MKTLKHLRGQLAEAAQVVYDEWDEEDEDLAGGGVCDLIADEMVRVLDEHDIDAVTFQASVGENHIFTVAATDDGVFSIDIPPHVYEVGAGYQWTKIPGVVFDEDDVVIGRLSNDPDDFVDFCDG